MKIIKVRRFMPRGLVAVTNYKLPLTPFVTRHENYEFIHVKICMYLTINHYTDFFDEQKLGSFVLHFLPIFSFSMTGAAIT